MDYLYEIAVDAPLATTLTYAQPSGRLQPIPVGVCVRVPLGNRQVTGFVLDILDRLSPGQEELAIKPITAILADSPFFPATLVPFYRWIARYYHHPIGEVVRTALPVAPGTHNSRQVSLTESGKAQLTGQGLPAIDASFHTWITALIETGQLGPESVRAIWRDPAQRRYLKKLERQEWITIKPVVQSSGSRPKTVTVLEPGSQLAPLLAAQPDADMGLITGHLEQQAVQLKPADRKVLGWFLEQYSSTCQPVSRKRLGEFYPGHGPALQRLAGKGLLNLNQLRVYRDPFGDELPYVPPPVQLTGEQQAALAHILPSIDAGVYLPFLLHGVTGCGKTEVYLQAAQQVLDAGKTALVLVPEIALASQLEAHFYSRFGQRLAVLHSGLSDGERLDQWQRVLTGEASVVMGARSAVFAPLERLGLIVVDEEHDPAYKQDDGLRYNGRDLAVLRAQQAGCPVILGSATPSVVSYFHAQQKKYTLLTMKTRVEQQPLPEVAIIDLANTPRSRPDLFFSDALIAAVRNTLEQRQQSLLFVNRRGFASFMLCRDCGHILQCRHCQVSLTLHRSKQQLLCHYCGFTQHPRSVCTACGSTRLTGLGLGSERIEQEVQDLFPEARVARLDSDTAVNRKQYLHTLKAVRAGEVDILIGTQMIAKGLHFPRITLVGVLWADSGLGMPDYKAAERTYALLAQVTGRAGRGAVPGRVLVQTYQPHHCAIELARHHRYETFYHQELAARKPLGYPPFSRLVNIRFSGNDEQQVQKTAEAVADYLRGLSPQKEMAILGPSPAPLIKLKDKTRWQLLLKSVSHTALYACCEALLRAKGTLCPRTVTMQLDVDPENMM